MATFSRSVEVAAPLDEVWDFHSRVEGLETLTPDWMRLRVERTVGPDGDEAPDVLLEGARVESSIRPFGVGPRQRWGSVIEARDERDGAASVRDVMTDGPVPHWEHTHAFTALDEDTTLVTDRVEYRLPSLGPLSVLGHVGLEPLFRYRHRRTRALLE